MGNRNKESIRIILSYLKPYIPSSGEKLPTKFVLCYTSRKKEGDFR